MTTARIEEALVELAGVEGLPWQRCEGVARLLDGVAATRPELAAAGLTVSMEGPLQVNFPEGFRFRAVALDGWGAHAFGYEVGESVVIMGVAAERLTAYRAAEKVARRCCLEVA